MSQWSKSKGDEEGLSKWDLALGMDHDSNPSQGAEPLGSSSGPSVSPSCMHLDCANHGLCMPMGTWGLAIND